MKGISSNVGHIRDAALAYVPTDQIKSMRFTAYAAGASFICLLFNLIALGIPWYYKPVCNATLLYCQSRNVGFARLAGDPAFAFLFLGGIVHFFAIIAVYKRWSGRTSCVPHSPLACTIFFAIAALLIMISVSAYGGRVNITKPAPIGKYGPGFGLTIFILFVEAFSSVALWVFRKEVDEVGGGGGDSSLPTPVQLPEDGASADPGRAYTQQTIHAHQFNVSQIANTWSKSKAHSTVLFLAIIDLLFLIIALGLPWWVQPATATLPQGTASGLFTTLFRLPSSANITFNSSLSVNETALLVPLRKAGDPAFAFAFLGFLFQIYALLAVVLRFLGRNDGFSSKLPHGLAACLIATGLTCICDFFAFVIYAGVFNTKEGNLFNNIKSSFGGGFVLIILDWLMTMSIIVVLIFKKGEVDSRGVTSNTATAGGGGGAPTPFPLYPQTQAPAYAQSYPQDSSYATDAFDNKGFVASSATVI